MEKKQYALGDIVMMKKQHPCGTNAWEIIRMGQLEIGRASCRERV